MSNAIYKKDLHDVALAVAQGSKAYADKKAEEVLWQVGEYAISTSDDNTTAYQKTVPAHATRCKIKRIYGLTQKFNPTTAYDDTTYSIKTMPSTVYDFDVSKVYGASYKVNQLVNSYTTREVAGLTITDNNNRTVSISGTAESTDTFSFIALLGLKANHKYLISASTNNTLSYQIGNVKESFTNTKILTFTSGTLYINFNATSGTTYNTTFITNLFDLTDSGIDDTSVDTAVAELQARGINPYAPNPYNSGSIRNLELTGIRSESENLQDFTDNASTTRNGITYETIDGKITTNGTATAWTQIKIINFNPPLENVYLRIFIGGTQSGTGGYYTQSVAGTYIYNNARHFGTGDNALKKLEVFANAGDVITNKTYQLMIVRSSTLPTTYSRSQMPINVPIDLSTILYNGSPLFEGNSLKAVNDVKDSITPYKATKKLGYVDLGTLNWGYASEQTDHERFFTSAISSIIKKVDSPSSLGNIKCAIYDNVTANQTYIHSKDKIICVDSSGIIYVYDSAYTDATTFQNSLNGVYLVYELATPIEVSIDWSDILRGIQGYSNGTITLQNTYNMDTSNTITYNSIIKEVLNTGVRLDGVNLANTALFETGAISTTSGTIGQDVPQDNRTRSNYIEVKPNTQYTLKWNNENINFFLYDENKVCLSKSIGGTFTTGATAKYVRFYSGLINENTKIMFNEGSTALSYRPYKSPVTVNFPTQASDAYSAGNVSNVRDFTTWKRGMNISKEDLGNPTWTYDQNENFWAVINDAKGSYSTYGNTQICRAYDNATSINWVDKTCRFAGSSNRLYTKDSLYDDAIIYKSAMVNEPLYYELADASKTETDITAFNNILEVEEGDTLTFLNSENMAVPSDITYRIEVAN